MFEMLYVLRRLTLGSETEWKGREVKLKKYQVGAGAAHV